MRYLLLGFIMLCIGSTAAAQVINLTEERASRSVRLAPSAINAPNTPQGEELAVMPWIVRNGNTFTTTYMFKDRDQFNSITLDTLDFFGVREDGVEVRYLHLAYPNCTQVINNDFLFYNLGFALGPDFDGYPIGARIHFRWRAVFRNPGCSTRVTKNQFFEVIKGQPLPMYAGQYPASLHNHSFYTDNLGEYGGSKNSIPQFWVVGGRIYLWTDHGYDFTAAECTQMAADATALSDANVLVMPGSEGNIDTDADNDFPDNFLHTLTNGCLRTPWEFPGDNSSSQLWTLQQFQDSVTARSGFWAAAHPFTSFDIPGVDGPLGIWQPNHVAQAMNDSRFVGWQIWNRPRSSTREDAGNLDTIDPYPWVADPQALQDLELGLARVDAIQQAYLSPLRRASILAGTDDHWDRAYALSLTSSGQVEIHNSALGKCFTVTEQPTLTATEFWNAVRDGRLYLTNGPGCRFGVDVDNNGDLETTFGAIHTSPSGTIRLFGQSNNEFGPFTRAIIYTITSTTRDSLIFPLTGLIAEIGLSTTAGGAGPRAIRARLETAGGYGDAPGLILTGWLYFNATVTGVETEPAPQFSLSVGPNPSSLSVEIQFSTPNHQVAVIDLYDIHGRRVAEIWRGQNTGPQTLRWQRPTSLAAGLYFIRLHSPSGQHQQKLLILP